MNLIARLKSLMGSHDEKLAEETLGARAAGVEHEHGVVGPGLDSHFERMAGKLESAEEHQEPR